MGKLKFICCGWEPEDGKEGEAKSPALQKLNPDYHLLVAMDAGDLDITTSGNGAALRDKRKVKHFTITVRVVAI